MGDRFCSMFCLVAAASQNIVYARLAASSALPCSQHPHSPPDLPQLDTLIKATIAGGGVIPHIHKSLVTNKQGKKEGLLPII